MARILVGTVPVAGHIIPMLPLVRALIARGHELHWYSGAKYRSKIEATGARFVPLSHMRDYDDAHFDQTFPGRGRLRGLAQIKFDMKHVFIDQAPRQMRDLEKICGELQPALVLGEPGLLGSLFLYERGGPPAVLLFVLPLVVGSVDAAPFGLVLGPSASPLGRLRNRALNFAVEHALFRDVQRHWNATREQVGLGPTGWWMNTVERAALCLQPTIPGFEYPRSDLPPNIHFVGMMPVDAPPAWVAPEFWPELDGKRPIVHVTQGTIANEAPSLIAPALAGLANEDVLVVVSTGGRSIDSLKLSDVPRNARVATFLSYPELLPKTAAMVTNGGYGGVQIALSHGVPLVVAGETEHKPEVAARVAWSGAGLNLKTQSPSPVRVREAVRRVLDDPTFRTRARALATEYAAHDALARATELIEAVAGARGSSEALPRRRLG
jgi:MGT family glycosyltransferase